MKNRASLCGADPRVRGRRPRRPLRGVHAAGPGGPARTRGSAPQCGFSTLSTFCRRKKTLSKLTDDKRRSSVLPLEIQLFLKSFQRIVDDGAVARAVDQLP